MGRHAHAKGPWFVGETDNSGTGVTIGPRDLNGGPVATVNLYRGTGDANARLIAAAPEMHDELALLYEQNHDEDMRRPGLHDAEHCQWCRIGALLAKIKG
jgi:hypothetical protein